MRRFANVIAVVGARFLITGRGDIDVRRALDRRFAEGGMSSDDYRERREVLIGGVGSSGERGPMLAETA